MNIHPLKISLYIIVALLALLGLTYVSKTHTIEVGKEQDGFSLFNNVIKYPTTSTFFKNPNLTQVNKQVYENIVENIETVVKEVEHKIPDFTKIDSTKIERISYPKASSDFIKKLRAQLESAECRIIHYGDSQLEGDRISAYLRNRLQGMYCGSGPGFIPIKQVYSQISADVTASENWQRFAAFDPSTPLFIDKNYGAYLSVSRFTNVYDPIADSLAIQQLEPTKATIQISPSSKLYFKLKEFTSIGLHYGNAATPIKIKVLNNGVLIKEDLLISDGNYHNYQINVPATPDNLQLELEGTISPDFYGLTLDGSKGVRLDNVAMRGNSGTTFASLNSKSFASMYQQLNPKVVIFQYGGNTVPYLKDSLQVTKYASYLKNHINWVRRKSPDASILFVGPSDMTTTINGELKSYALLNYLDETLKQECVANNVAYWSMYKAMGGENSMSFWVDKKLAGSDYTHFTAQGTQIISELFFTALYMDLKNSK